MCNNCDDPILNPVALEEPFCLDCVGDRKKCVHKFRAECVIYNIDNETPSQLVNLGIQNKTPLDVILSKIDGVLGHSLSISLTLMDSPTVSLSRPVGGISLGADVKVSQQAGNFLQAKADGLYVGSGVSDFGKVKVNQAGSLGFLQNKILGGTDGIVSTTTVVSSDILQVEPTINIAALLDAIKNDDNLRYLFCQIVDMC